MRENRQLLAGVFAALMASSLMACHPGPMKSANQPLTITIPPFPIDAAKDEVSSSAAPELPSAVTDFDCIYVNVMGSGITPDSNLYGDYESIQTSVNTLGTVALSRVSEPISSSAGGTITMTGLSGNDRIVSLIGVKAPSGCPTTKSASDLNNTTVVPFATELTRTTISVLDTSTVNFQLDRNGYGSSVESRLDLKLAAPTFVSSSPSTTIISTIPTSMVLTYSVNMAKPALSNFSITSNTCTTAPTISAVSADGAAITLTLSGGSCSNGQAFTVTWPGGFKNLSGVAGADSAHNVTLTYSTIKKIFVTQATVSPQLGVTAAAAVTAADTACATDTNKPDTGTYKAMIAAGASRQACSSANCTTSGVSENVNWVLIPNKTYHRSDGTTAIGTTNAAGLFAFPLSNSLDGGFNSLLTGLVADWTSDTTENCMDWTDSSTGTFRTGYSGGTSTAAIDMGVGSKTPCNQPTKLICVQQ